MEILNEIEASGVADWAPRMGMVFESLEDAWNYWKGYGAKMGFHVRKHFKNEKTKGKITSRGFVCGNQGQRETDKRNREVKKPRAETRTGCPVRICLKLVQDTHNYQIYDFCGDHNHALHRPEAVGLIPSQREIPDCYKAAINLADESGIRPKESYELMGREVGGSENLPFRKRDYVNHIRNSRKRNLAGGEAASMLRYFYKQSLENSSFQHTEHIDKNGQITSVFWADAKMLIDYALFGEVVTFDTTYGTNKEHRPLGVFVGFNHFREIVVFGVTLLYEETTDSFKWLFKTFLTTHNNKHPKTIFTDQDPGMAAALGKTMPNTYHGLCTFHISRNALKNLTRKKKSESGTKVNGQLVLKAFKACMYDYDDKNDFEDAFEALFGMVRGVSNTIGDGSSKDIEECEDEEGSEVSEEDPEVCGVGLKDGSSDAKCDGESWLNFIYKVKEKWAKCYMKDEVTLGMRSTQLSESFNKDLKSFLKWNMDIIRFLKKFEQVLEQKRKKEIDSEYEMIRKNPRVKVKVPVLQQTGALYTPKIFEIFQNEWELSIASFVKSKIEGQSTTEYVIGVTNFGDGYTPEVCYEVIANRTDQIVSCSCNKFNIWGVLCGHALKVLDVMDIKLLPDYYILKRWTREARSGTVEDFSGRTIVENPKLDATRRYRALAQKLLKAAVRAADFEEIYEYADAAASIFINKIDEKVRNHLSNSNDGTASFYPAAQSDLGSQEDIPESLSQNPISFKEKSGRKGGKRIRSWVDSCPKQNKKKPASKEKCKSNKGQLKKSASQIEQHQNRKEIELNNLPLPNASSELQDYEHINTFMNVLVGSGVSQPFSLYDEDNS